MHVPAHLLTALKGLFKEESNPELINAVNREAPLGVLIKLCYNSERSGADKQERRGRWRKRQGGVVSRGWRNR